VDYFVQLEPSLSQPFVSRTMLLDRGITNWQRPMFALNSVEVALLVGYPFLSLIDLKYDNY